MQHCCSSPATAVAFIRLLSSARNVGRCFAHHFSFESPCALGRQPCCDLCYVRSFTQRRSYLIRYTEISESHVCPAPAFPDIRRPQVIFLALSQQHIYERLVNASLHGATCDVQSRNWAARGRCRKHIFRIGWNPLFWYAVFRMRFKCGCPTCNNPVGAQLHVDLEQSTDVVFIVDKVQIAIFRAWPETQNCNC